MSVSSEFLGMVLSDKEWNDKILTPGNEKCVHLGSGTLRCFPEGVIPSLALSRKTDNHRYPYILRTVAAQLHLFGVILAIVGAAFLLPSAKSVGQAEYWASLAFIIGGVLVFVVSSAYHFVDEAFDLPKKLEDTLENLDHFSIYLFIAGTYTPVLVSLVSDPWRKILLVTIWSMAIIGIGYTAVRPKLPQVLQHRWIYTGAFVVMGWTILVRIEEVAQNLSSAGMVFFLAGGTAYSIGAAVYALKRPNLYEGVFGFHELWHLMVLIGFSFHFLMIHSLYWT